MSEEPKEEPPQLHVSPSQQAPHHQEEVVEQLNRSASEPQRGIESPIAENTADPALFKEPSVDQQLKLEEKAVDDEPTIHRSPNFHTAKTLSVPITHMADLNEIPAGISLVESPSVESPKQDPPEGFLGRRRVSFSGSSEKHNWSVEVKHVIKEQPQRELQETQGNHDNRSISSTSQCGNASELNREIEGNHLSAFRRYDSIRQPSDSDDSQADKEEEKMRREELHRLAEENKLRIEAELAQSKKLQSQMEDQAPFGRRLFSSVVFSAVVGGATALITKNKKNSIIAGLVTLAASFIIQ